MEYQMTETQLRTWAVCLAPLVILAARSFIA
jgi:hypothetical protein